jgi:hypothetical protein
MDLSCGFPRCLFVFTDSREKQELYRISLILGRRRRMPGHFLREFKDEARSRRHETGFL